MHVRYFMIGAEHVQNYSDIECNKMGGIREVWNSFIYGYCHFQPVNTKNRPPLWSSGQSSWLLIQRSGFDSRR
jgi:hypothetical protein